MQLLQRAMEQLGLSARAYHRILKLNHRRQIGILHGLCCIKPPFVLTKLQVMSNLSAAEQKP